MNARAGFRHDQHDGRIEQLRVPPHSIDAEQAVLGGLMLAPEAYDRIAGMIETKDFYRRDHQLIHQAICELAEKNRPYDAVTLGEWFKAQGQSEQIAGGAYLVELASTTPSAANIVAYADIVGEKATMRRLIEVGTGIINDGFQPDGRDSTELIGEAQHRIGSLLSNQACELESIQPIMGRVFDTLQRRYESGGAGGITGKSMGLRDVEEILNGLKAGLYILAARPKMGKTTLAQNIAEHFAIVRKESVAIFSFEMSEEELGERMLSSVGDIDGDRVRRGNLDDIDWANVTAAVRKLRGANIYVSKPRNAKVALVCAQARRQHAKGELGLIVVDYLQLMDWDGDNAAQGFGQITRQLKLLSEELNVPIVVLSQLNRKLEERPNKRPMPSDLRDSGAIEQDADAVIFIYRDEWYHPNSPDRGTAEIIVALQRSGAPGMARVAYRPDRYRFENLPVDWEPAPLPEKVKKRAKGMAGALAGKDAAAGADA
jgi:replicative DNA helicase